MSMTFRRSLLPCALAATAATTAAADVPRVATDVAPVHGLVARVMAGVGEPETVVQPGSSPHSYSMRPSEARALEQADLVFWVGEELEPWLAGAVETLASDARIVELLDAPGITTLEFRQGATFGGHDHEGHEHAVDDRADHDHEAEDHADHDHEGAEHGHDNEGHAEHTHDHEDHDHGGEAHEDHDHESDDHAGHDHAHDGVDPHAWLDPENGKVWLDLIAEELAALDPENAETYRSNAAAGQDEIDGVIAEVRETLSAAGAIDFVVFHDAYHYFENRFDVPAAGAISLSDASDPTPARVEEIRDTVRELGVACVFSEPQFDQRLVRTVLDGTEGQAGVIDPLGFEIEMGPDFYPALIRSIAEEMAGCAS
ncbi:zinc ABC transporter substrate-binding protein [Roseivivax sediminis]|uniref:High-affinity zinc uptake system protein ZnuA n=1 Tax=Roseivivax sediminis TaxID=936889 RepID=A0A1I2BPI3_9RHOB|nr:zinc ABC transporter substrate-binding protein [Roseivivax sediminis]SFE58032.1 zinc transport system substrate-binding protein [Roseivivax sediminis]